MLGGSIRVETCLSDASIEFLERALGPRGDGHWRWKYPADANGVPRGVADLRGDGRVQGFVGLLPTMLHVPAGPIPAYWMVDWVTSADARRCGIGCRLLDRAQAAVPILVGLGGSASTRVVLPHLGWQRADGTALWRVRLTARCLADRRLLRRRPQLGPPLRFAARLLAHRYRVRPLPSGVSLARVDRFPPEYDAVVACLRTGFAPLMDRATARLNRSCTRYPGGGYLCFLLVEGGVPIGHLVLRQDGVNGFRRGRIIDVLWPRDRPGVVAWLVRRATWMLQERGADYVECTSGAPALSRALRACRFRRVARLPLWYRGLPPHVPPPATWFVTFLDADRAYR